MTETYIVTGGAGFIGSHIAERLLRDGQRVRIIDNFATGKHVNLAHLSGDLQVHEVSITDRESLDPIFAGADYVFHQAALASVPRSVADPLTTHEANATGTLNVLIAARDAGVKRVIYAASSSAYGEVQVEAQDETLSPHPLSPYGVSKLAGEFYCQSFTQVYGLETVALRYFNVFGPRQDETSQYSAVIPRFISAMLGGNAPTIYGDGKQSRDFTYVDNVVHGNLLALKAPGASGEVMNLAVGGSVSLLELVDKLNRQLGTSFEPIHAPERAGDIKYSRADVSKAIDLLDFAPITDFDAGLAHTVEWFKETPMKVAHIIKATRISGAERHLLILLPALKARGVDVSLILLEAPLYPVDDMVAQLTTAGVPVVRIPIYRHLDWGVVGRIRAALRDLRPDMVHTHLIHADLYGTIAARLARVRTIISSRHNDDSFRRLLPIRLMSRLLWHMTSGGIAISQAIARFCIDVEGARPDKITTVYYGMTLHEQDRNDARKARLSERNLPNDALLVGMVCRLIDQKGVVYGLRAFAQIAPRFPNAYLLIAGDGSRRSALEAEAKTLGIADRVQFLGWQKDTSTLLASLDILLMPSLWEGFGLVMLEAMAQSVPIIGSAVSAIPEVVLSGETGLLVPPRDAAALAAALEQLFSDAALRRHMGMMGQDRLETTFSVERMAADTLAVYNRFV